MRFLPYVLSTVLIFNPIITVRPLSAADDLSYESSYNQDSLTKGSLLLDISNINNGVVKAYDLQQREYARLIVSVNGNSLIYRVFPEECVIPLQYGSGEYSFSLVTASGDITLGLNDNITINARLQDENAPFLHSNQYVNYANSVSVASIAEQLFVPNDEQATYNNIHNYMCSTYSYDYAKAASISDFQLPKIEECIAKQCGICQDLAALSVSLLRCSGIPAKLNIGFADSSYHAWVTATINGEEVLFDPTAEIMGVDFTSYAAERFY